MSVSSLCDEMISRSSCVMYVWFVMLWTDMRCRLVATYTVLFVWAQELTGKQSRWHSHLGNLSCNFVLHSFQGFQTAQSRPGSFESCMITWVLGTGTKWNKQITRPSLSYDRTCDCNTHKPCTKALAAGDDVMKLYRLIAIVFNLVK